jgi:hypothetical protein
VDASIATQQDHDIAGTCGRDERLKNNQNREKAISKVPAPRASVTH